MSGNQENQAEPSRAETHLEATPVEGAALEVMERAQIDTQIATAHKFPRSLAVFMKRAKDMVSIDKETAASCLYSRPVGKVNGQMKYAQGESIRLAEIVAATYGNIRVGAIITEMTPHYVKAVGMAHDLESNFGFKAEVVESTLTKKGFPYSERQRLVTAKAAQSKAIRDAIFRIVPKSLCKPISNVAKDVALGAGETLEQRRDRVMEWVERSDIDPDRVFADLNVGGLEELTQDHLLTLTGVRTAIIDGDITIDEAFPPIVTDEEKQVGIQGLKQRIKKNDKTPPLPTEEPDADFQAKQKEQVEELKAEADEIAAEIKDESCPQTVSADEADAHLAGKLRERRYKCNNPICNGIFDEALKSKGKDGETILVCPECNYDDVTDCGEPEND